MFEDDSTDSNALIDEPMRCTEDIDADEVNWCKDITVLLCI